MRYIRFLIFALLLSAATGIDTADYSNNPCIAGRYVPEIIKIEYVAIDGFWYELIYYDNGDLIMHSTGRPVDGEVQDGKDALSMDGESLLT
ncbi:MAG: hypothetical protein L0Y76_00645 [Ignavibacteria bacterium]|nr:hypothetical protein [Ignavibacteria bacterium]